jgi:DNA-binding transcriptional LysR family regulator
MDYNEIAVFIKVVQKGSFRAAADALQMPKSTVSLKISNLENRLGTSLLKRTTRRLHLTEAGQRYFQRMTGAFEEIRNAETDLISETTEPTGRLRITAPVDLGNYILCDLVSEYRKKYPKVNVDLLLTDRRVDLIQEDVDLAIRAGKLKDSSLMAKKVDDVFFAAFASPKYLRQKGFPREPKELESHDCILFAPISTTEWTLQKQKKTHTVQLPPKLIVNDITLAYQFAVAGEGIALLPTFICHSAVADGKLQRVLPDWRRNVSQISFVYPAQKYKNAAVHAFIEMSTEPMRIRFQRHED